MAMGTEVPALDWLCCVVNKKSGQSTGWRQLIRYGIIGLATNALGYCIYLLLTTFLLPPKLSMTILYAAGAIMGFIGNRRFTFDHHGDLSRSAQAYTLAHLLGWAMSYALLYVFSDLLGYPHQYVQAMSIFIVAGYLFLALRYFVFPTRMKI